MPHNLQHLAIIMDGNRRYAKKNKLLPWNGHKKGIEAVREAIIFCLKNNILYLSLYTFSLENFNRSPKELEYLFSLLITGIQKNELEILEKNIKINFIGDRKKFPPKVLKAAMNLEQKTNSGKALIINILFCYGGRQEIVAATTKIAADITAGKLQKTSITQEIFKKYLWLPTTPDPDLIIRTGGAQRLSNFLLFQAAYAELYFTNIFWPEINEEELNKALLYYKNIHQNFGF